MTFFSCLCCSRGLNESLFSVSKAQFFLGCVTWRKGWALATLLVASSHHCVITFASQTCCEWSPCSLPQRSFEFFGAVVTNGLSSLAGGLRQYFSAEAAFYVFQAWGQKDWTLFAPDHALFSALPTKEFTRRYQNTPLMAHSVQCTQKAGDVLLVPHNWGPLRCCVSLQVQLCVCIHLAPSIVLKVT